ncbi:MAG: NACHT domain-containing protein [Desulfobacteraceae bacterium]|nr:NACHT domain-containing protein [Desulfobacteraceae bacterium]
MQNWLIQNIQWLIVVVIAMVITAGLTLILARRKRPAIPISSENNASARDVSDSCFVVGNYNQVTQYIQNMVAEAGGDPAKLREAYLYALQCDAGFLSLQGIDPKAASCAADSRMKLDAVYTALLTEEAERSDKHEISIPVMPRRISALEVLDQHPHVVLLGNPGTGKSTFVNFIAWCMSGGLLGESQKYLDLLTAPLPSDDDEDKDRRQSWRRNLLLPIRIILRDFAAKGDISFNGLWKFIADELGKYKLRDYEQHLFKELQENGGLWLLDGLDEVPEADNCRIRIRQTVQDLIKSFRKCRILVTSRTYAYRKQDWQIPGLHEAELARFSDAQIRKFIDLWYAHVAELRQSDTASARAELLKQAVFSNPRIQELAERPLLLTLMASLHSWRGGSLPEKREQLYADTTELLLDTWERQRVLDHPSLIEWLKTDKTRMRRVLNELAYNAHVRQPKNEAGTADIAESELLRELCRISDDNEIKPKLLIQFLSNRSGLLIPRGVGIFSFPHRTFQEYLSACHLTENDYPEKIAELTRKEPNRWREVCLLAGAKQGAGVVWSLADHLCFKDADNSSVNQEDIWGAQMAGQALSETAILDKVSPANQIKLDRVRNG